MRTFSLSTNTTAAWGIDNAAGAFNLAWASAGAGSVSSAGEFSVRSVPGAPAPARAATGGEFSVQGSSAHTPGAAASIRLQLVADVSGCVPTTSPVVRSGEALALCLQIVNTGRSPLTHHRLYAPALGIDQVVAVPVAAGGVLTVTPAQIAGLAFTAGENRRIRIDLHSTSGNAASEAASPFPAVARLDVDVVVFDASSMFYLPLVSGR